MYINKRSNIKGKSSPTFPVYFPEAVVRIARFDDLPQEPDLCPIVLLEGMKSMHPAVHRLFSDEAAPIVRIQERLQNGDRIAQRGKLAPGGIHRVQEILVLSSTISYSLRLKKKILKEEAHSDFRSQRWNNDKMFINVRGQEVAPIQPQRVEYISL